MCAKDVSNIAEVGRLIQSAKKLAVKYRRLRGRPLGITGEVAEYEAARILELELSDARQAGYDATRRHGKRLEKIQIKGRCILSRNPGQRVGKIDLAKPWDCVVLVLLDEQLNPLEIFQAERTKIEEALEKPGSKARNQRWQMSVSRFKAIGRKIWERHH